jgi:ribosomal protein S18 acetylase RimI-like enzyme
MAEAERTPPQPTAVGDLTIRYRQGTVKDCEWIRRIICSCGFITYEGLEDGPTQAHFEAEWAGRWAERLVDPDQVYAVAETERYQGTPEVIGFARMQRNRPQMRMTALATHLLSGAGAPTEAAAIDELDNQLVGPRYDAELMSLFIASDIRGHGVGTKLMNMATELASTKLGAKTCFTWCVDDEASREFYRKCGGTVIGLKQSNDGVPGCRDGMVRTQTAFAFQCRCEQHELVAATEPSAFS